MNIDYRNRNSYNCEGFGQLARNCRNKRTGDGIEEGRKLEYENGNNRQRLRIEGGNRQNSNLNRNQDLILLD